MQPISGERRSRCPVCGSHKLMPSLGRLGGGDHAEGNDAPIFSWRCRVCRTTLRPVQGVSMWRKRRPLGGILGRRRAAAHL